MNRPCFFVLLLAVSINTAKAQRANTLIYVGQSWFLAKDMVVNRYINDSIYTENSYTFDFTKNEWLPDEREPDTFRVNMEGGIFKLFNGEWHKHISKDDFTLKAPFFEYFDRQEPTQEYLRYTPVAMKNIAGWEVWIYDVRLMNINHPLDDEYRLFYIPKVGEIKRSSYYGSSILKRFVSEQWVKDL